MDQDADICAVESGRLSAHCRTGQVRSIGCYLPPKSVTIRIDFVLGRAFFLCMLGLTSGPETSAHF